MTTPEPSALTPEIMALLGQEWVYHAPEEIGAASIRKFALSIGDPNPIYADKGYASGTGYGGIIAPPTFVCETMQYMVGELDETGGPAARVQLSLGSEIRGSNDYHFHQALRPDDLLTVRWRVADIRERDGRTGKLVIVTSEVSYWNQHGALLATNAETNLFRVSDTPVQVEPAPSAESPPLARGDSGRSEPRRLDRPLSFREVHEGDELPELEKRINLPMMVFYAAATWDFHRYHYDQEFVRKMGFSKPFVDGQMLGAFLGQMLTDWTGDPGTIRQLAFRFREFAFPGDTLTCRGRVTGKEAGEHGGTVTCELSIERQDGRPVLSPGHAVLALG
jgi:acyl dehydratase